jgi:cytoskeletal protein CcmA (bactofilin family)
MFGNKKTAEENKPVAMNVSNNAAPATRNTVNPNALNSLVKGTTVEGTVTSENDIRVDGIIKGILSCAAKVIIGPSGLIEGEIRCQNALIEGRFHGKIKVAELLQVNDNAEVVGEVTTQKLQVQPGAVFNVTCHMSDSNNTPNVVKTAATAATNGATNGKVTA